MMPSIFVAHGAPSLVLEEHPYTDFLKGFHQRIPQPKAILLFSAHWESGTQLVSAVEEYSTIYDFGGFPDELYQMVYPAKGDPVLANQIVNRFNQAGILAKLDSNRGLDHGAWVVLKLLYPDANIPVIALSVNPYLSNQQQYEIGKTLASLREEDVLIIGSGGTVHNLRRLTFEMGKKAPEEADSWAVAFDDWLTEKMENWDLEALFSYEEKAPYAREAVPRNEHFIPLILAMGAGDQTKKVTRLHQSYQFGSLSLACWQFE